MSTSKQSLQFPKQARLRKRAEFDSVFQGAVRVGSRYVLARVAPNGKGRPRVGFAVPRKMGCIAVRNRARRLLREAYRLNQHVLTAGVDVVLIPTRAWTDRRMATVEPSVRSVLRKIQAKAGREVDPR